MSAIHISELAIYPVKSFSQISLLKSQVDNFGLTNDRRWMVIDQNGRFITQRQQSRMCLIKVSLIFTNLQTSAIQLSAPGMLDITVKLDSTNDVTKVTVWQDQCNALDCGSAIANWLSEFLSVQCRLVYFADEEIRQVDSTFAQKNDRTAFSDGFPILLISQASLDALNSKLDVAIPMKRFRPNLVVSGCNAFEEDKWKLLRIGDMLLRVVKPCSRCVIPSIDTETGERGEEPTKTLLTFRRRDHKIFFGQNVIANSTGHLAVGDTVEVLE
ncbi:Flavodoxin reductases (ferredoxin-NADPH reductases) family 1 [hydrothermal vent metagenome]|uniref:Flavodoxin reductases (Ferredoxin-NADPH reductases) family 1 n=1 Tax=hydrothermal vent metagenome TaxID=652676 RepID=A0A3B1AFQ0_9ZZZZ